MLNRSNFALAIPVLGGEGLSFLPRPCWGCLLLKLWFESPPAQIPLHLRWRYSSVVELLSILHESSSSTPVKQDQIPPPRWIYLKTKGLFWDHKDGSIFKYICCRSEHSCIKLRSINICNSTPKEDGDRRTTGAEKTWAPGSGKHPTLNEWAEKDGVGHRNLPASACAHLQKAYTQIRK